MENLQITKERILAAASKCDTAKETLQTLFPEAFGVEGIYDFGESHEITTNYNPNKPLFIGVRLSPEGFEHKCLVVTFGWKAELKEGIPETDGADYLVLTKIKD